MQGKSEEKRNHSDEHDIRLSESKLIPISEVPPLLPRLGSKKIHSSTILPPKRFIKNVKGGNMGSQFSGSLISLSQASELLPRFEGKKVHTCTLWRWCRKGLNGVQLDYFRVGRRICTTQAALDQFFVALTEKDSAQQETIDYPKTIPTNSSKLRQSQIHEANTTLDKAGL